MRRISIHRVAETRASEVPPCRVRAGAPTLNAIPDLISPRGAFGPAFSAGLLQGNCMSGWVLRRERAILVSIRAVGVHALASPKDRRTRAFNIIVR